MRALVLVLDSVGIGHAPDAAKYGDAGANTLGHILAQTDLALPNLCSLGLSAILGGTCFCTSQIFGRAGKGSGRAEARPSEHVYRASYGRMQERSAGKDTTTGHWEIAGVLLEELGAEHLGTGRLILYTSADSVLQIAAHESVVPAERLYEICRHARTIADSYRIGRVIARPFVGEPGNFKRTANRHDFSIQPPRTILDALVESGIAVIGVGKISDTFAGRGITKSFPTVSNHDGMDRIDQLWKSQQPALIFANLVDFDMLYGHRRDVSGYANALREFDDWLGRFTRRVSPNELVIITADHGNDPTHPGTDHAREQVPLFMVHDNQQRDLGLRLTFADAAATLAQYFELLAPWGVGESFLS